MPGNFGLFCSFSQKLPRTPTSTLNYIILQRMRKIKRDKGY